MILDTETILNILNKLSNQSGHISAKHFFVTNNNLAYKSIKVHKNILDVQNDFYAYQFEKNKEAYKRSFSRIHGIDLSEIEKKLSHFSEGPKKRLFFKDAEEVTELVYFADKNLRRAHYYGNKVDREDMLTRTFRDIDYYIPRLNIFDSVNVLEDKLNIYKNYFTLLKEFLEFPNFQDKILTKHNQSKNFFLKVVNEFDKGFFEYKKHLNYYHNKEGLLDFKERVYDFINEMIEYNPDNKLYLFDSFHRSFLDRGVDLENSYFDMNNQTRLLTTDYLKKQLNINIEKDTFFILDNTKAISHTFNNSENKKTFIINIYPYLQKTDTDKQPSHNFDTLVSKLKFYSNTLNTFKNAIYKIKSSDDYNIKDNIAILDELNKIVFTNDQFHIDFLIQIGESLSEIVNARLTSENTSQNTLSYQELFLDKINLIPATFRELSLKEKFIEQKNHISASRKKI